MCGGKGSQTGGGVGALGWGGLAPAQQQTTQASPEAMGWYRQAMQLGQQATSRPFQQFGTTPEQFVAQLNPVQQQAISNIAGTQGMAQPYFQGSAGVLGQALTPASQTVGQYMTPYTSQVIDPVRQAVQQQQGQQLAQQQAEAIRGGAFGGERAGLQRAQLMGQQNLGLGQALSPLYQTGYGQALQAAQQQQQYGLQGAQQLAGLGTAAQNAALQQAQAQLGAGTLGQQTQQAGINALYNQFQQAQMFPYMQAQFLGGLAGGLGPLMGQQTYQAQAMSPFGSFLGFAEGGAVDEDAVRMGGAVTHEGDYARGGYAKGGVMGDVSYDDTPDYGEDLQKLYTEQGQLKEMPTGQIQAARGLEPVKFDKPDQPKSGLDKLSQLTQTAKNIFGLGKDVYGMLSNKSDESETGGMGSRAEEDSGSSTLGTLGKLGLSAAANYFLPGSGFLAGLFAEGGRVGYADGGDSEDDDVFERGLLGAESARRQFDKTGRVLTSPKGALGIAQIMPGTAPEAAKLAGLDYDPERLRSDEAYNKALGRAYYNEQLRKFGTPELALAAYNAGPGRVQKAIEKAGPGGDVMSLLPAETRAYVPRAMGLAGADADAAIRRAKTLDRGFMAKADLPEEGATVDLAGGVKPSDEEGLGLNRQTIIPALVGLGSALEGAMGAKTTSLGSALASGLGAGLVAGGKSYMDVGKQIPEIAKLKAEVPKIAAETREREALAGRTAAETKEKLATLYEKQWVPNVGWMVYDKTQPFKTPVQISDPEGKPLAGTPSPDDVPTRAGADKPAPTAPTVQPAPVAAALDWQPTLTAPKGHQIPGSLNIALSGDLPKQQAAASAEIERQRQKASSSYDQLYRLEEMDKQFKNLPESGMLQPGAYADLRASLAKDANTFVTALGGKPIFDPSQVGAAEELAKDTTRLGFAVAQGLGHEPGFIVERSIKANPGMENTAVGYQRITAGLKEAAKYEQDKLAFMENYSARFGTLAGADQLFRKMNPPEAYAKRAILSTIDPADMDYIRTHDRKTIEKNSHVIDRKYGQGTTEMLLGK